MYLKILRLSRSSRNDVRCSTFDSSPNSGNDVDDTRYRRRRVSRTSCRKPAARWHAVRSPCVARMAGKARGFRVCMHAPRCRGRRNGASCGTPNAYGGEGFQARGLTSGKTGPPRRLEMNPSIWAGLYVHQTGAIAGEVSTTLTLTAFRFTTFHPKHDDSANCGRLGGNTLRAPPRSREPRQVRRSDQSRLAPPANRRVAA